MGIIIAIILIAFVVGYWRELNDKRDARRALKSWAKSKGKL